MKMVMVEVSLVSQVARYHLEGVALKPWGQSWGVCMVLTGPCSSTPNPIPHPRSSKNKDAGCREALPQPEHGCLEGVPSITSDSVVS